MYETPKLEAKKNLSKIVFCLRNPVRNGSIALKQCQQIEKTTSAFAIVFDDLFQFHGARKMKHEALKQSTKRQVN